jgi:hypothetical protein
MACFIDTMRPVTATEQQGWATFLALPAPRMRAGFFIGAPAATELMWV